MKRIGLAMVAIFALVGGIAIAEDMDVRALQAKLAAQEARLNDLQAKMYGAAYDEKVVADGITSLRKKAVVTLGGLVNTRYFMRSGNIKSEFNQRVSDDATLPRPGRTKVADYRHGDMCISDAKLEVKIDVNENFDAYVKMDLQDGNFSRAGVGQNYWIRWKNVCNTGFGLLVGRDTLKFGGVTPYGAIGSFVKTNDGAGDILFSRTAGEDGVVSFGYLGGGASAGGEGMLLNGSMVPTHTIWDHSRTTQITPYWETQDGSFKVELSLIQSVDTLNGVTGTRQDSVDNCTDYRSINYGLGSGTLHFTWKPIEGLKLVASGMNVVAKNGNGYWGGPRTGQSWNTPLLYIYEIDGTSTTNTVKMATNNTAVNFAFEYRPCFFNRLNLWATYTHGWNEGWVKDQDSDVLSYGFGLDLTEQLTFFAQGDYMRVKNDQGNVWHKSTGWGGYTGLIYTLPYGANIEAGYRHEQFTFKDRAGVKHTKARADTIYGHFGFSF